MKVFIKKYWQEEGILFYLHFEGEELVRQIEMSGDQKVCLSIENPIIDDKMLGDQNLSCLEYEPSDVITEQGFESIWE